MEWIQNAYTLQTFCLHFSHINQELPSKRQQTRTPCGFRFGGESVGNWPLVDFNQEIVCDAERGEREREIAGSGLGAVFVRFAPRGKLGERDEGDRNRTGSRPDFSSEIT